MLKRKLWRTAKVYKVQFISMILLIALGIGVFVGFNAEWVTIGEDTGAFFKDCGFADYRIIDEDGISSADVDKIRDIDGVSGVSRFLSVNADVKDSGNQLALTVTESEHTSGFVLMEGEKYDRWDPDGLWLMDKYAELNGIKPGDKLTVTFEDMEFSGTVRGLIESAEYLICVRDESQVMPDFNTYGYVYASPAMLRKVVEEEIREEEPDIDLSGEVNRFEVPRLYQWDARWGYKIYGSGPMGLTGCGPTCLSMVAIHLLGNTDMNPAWMAEYAMNNGYYDYDGNSGTYWTLMTDGAFGLGIDVTEIPTDEDRMIRNLEVGNPIIAIVGEGEFTDNGHFIVITGYEGGYFTVNDPNSYTRSDRLWTFDELEEEIITCWVYRIL